VVPARSFIILQGGRVFLFFSVSVEECAFKAPTKYGTHRWTPGGNILMTYSDDNGDTWSEPNVRAFCTQTRCALCHSHHWSSSDTLYTTHVVPTVQFCTSDGHRLSLQTVLDFEAEGGVPKVIANKLAIGTDGGWLLPFWRENECAHAVGSLHNLCRSCFS
jgi:hypothetical protein